MEENNKSSNRRSYMRKLLGLGAAAGATSLLLNADKSMIPLAQAGSGTGTELNIDQINYGVGKTSLYSDPAGDPAFFSQNGSFTPGSTAIQGYASNLSGSTYGVYGQSDSNSGYGVYGYTTNASGATYGVYGDSASIAGVGLYGYAGNVSGTTYGVIGYSGSIGGNGVNGIVGNLSGSTKGVYGYSASILGTGVYGYATNASGGTYGVLGTSASIGGAGVYGSTTNTSGGTFGVYGHSASIAGKGVYGSAANASGNTFGVYGNSSSIVGTGVFGYANNASGNTKGVNGTSYSNQGIGVYGSVFKPTGMPIIAQGASGQTASLQEWWNSAGTALSVVDKSGCLGVGLSSPARSVHLQGNNACFRMDRDTNSAAFILVRTALNDPGTIWKTFYVGVDATGVDNGEFFIGDRGNQVSGDSVRRLWIDNSGGVHVPNLVSGDMKFANDYTLTEDKESGVLLRNEDGETIAKFDHDGNLHIKGKVMEDL